MLVVGYHDRSDASTQNEPISLGETRYEAGWSREHWDWAIDQYRLGNLILSIANQDLKYCRPYDAVMGEVLMTVVFLMCGGGKEEGIRKRMEVYSTVTPGNRKVKTESQLTRVGT